MNVTTLDWIIVVVSVAISFLPAVLLARRAGSSTAEFFTSGRSAPWWLIGVSMVATTFSTDTPNLVTNMVREKGVANNWLWWSFLLTGMMTVFFYARMWRRSGVLTDLEFYEIRYSGKAASFVRGFRSIYLGLLFNCVIMATVNLAASKIASVVLGWPMKRTLVICAVLNIAFAATSGLWGVLVTDFIQFGIAMTGSFAAAYFALKQPEIGGLTGLFQKIDPKTLVSSGLSDAQASVKARLFVKAINARREMGASSEGVHYYFVPGRIEFLGKHTDYAGGRSLICALERGFCVAASARDDSRVRITDAARNLDLEFSTYPELIPRSGNWANYPMTVASRVAQNFPGTLRGADIAFASDLPPAAGLSSSSALIIAVFASLARINALHHRDEYKRNIHSLEDLAGYLGTVENGQTFGSLAGNKGVGTFGGSQDHTAILCCRPGELSQYSFCPVRNEGSIALPTDYVFVIGVSGVAAVKTRDALEKYNRVSSLAAEVLAVWQSATGRTGETLMTAATSSIDAPELIRAALTSSRSAAFSPTELLNRFDQLLTECTEIIPGVVQSLAAGEFDKVGALVDRSQDRAERLLGNQVPETVALTRIARELGAAAASAFGAGFGGSVWAMVRTDRAESFMLEWAERYRSRFPESAKRSAFFSSCAGPSMIEFAG